jgi:cyclophilin family peptidyl-prolyl cis-trans isomerase
MAAHLTIKTAQGVIVVRLRNDVAPRSCDVIRKIVGDKLYDGCGFYR